MDEEREPTDEAQTVTEPGASETTLEQLLDTPVARRETPLARGPACLIGECIDDRHPHLQGRVRVRFADAADGTPRERWMPRLQGLAVRVGDRVLMLRPDNASWGDDAEWVVTGVLDGFARRPQVDKQEAARIELQPDESLRVVSREGQALVELSYDRNGDRCGPIVRLLEPDVRVELAGKLAIKAEQVELEAVQGEVAIKASADVVLRGEVIRLN